MRSGALARVTFHSYVPRARVDAREHMAGARGEGREGKRCTCDDARANRSRVEKTARRTTPATLFLCRAKETQHACDAMAHASRERARSPSNLPSSPPPPSLWSSWYSEKHPVHVAATLESAFVGGATGDTHVCQRQALDSTASGRG